MQTKFFMFFILTALSTSSYAEPVRNIIKDGQVVVCKTPEENGTRVFEVNLKNLSKTQFMISVDTFLCENQNGIMKLKSLPFSNPTRANNTVENYSYEIIKTSILVLNNDNTELLIKLSINPDFSSQSLIINKSAISLDSVDVTLTGVGITKLNGKIVDEGPTSGGHWRFSNLLN